MRGLAALAAVALAAALPLTAQASTSGPTTRAFESHPVGSVPSGCTTPSGYSPAAVSDQRAYPGAHSLEVSGQSTSSQTVVSCPSPAQQGAYLAFEVYPAALANGFIFDINGDTLAPVNFVDNAVFHLRVQPDGEIRWDDGVTWRPLAPAGTVPTGQWSQVQVAVPADLSDAWRGDGRGPRPRSTKVAPLPLARASADKAS